MKVRVSIVVYQPDLALLNTVLDAVINAYIAFNSSLEGLDIDIINNHLAAICTSSIQLRKAEGMRTIQIIHASSNLGYGGGNNLSLLQNDSDYHLVLNPDAIIDETFFVEGISFMQSNQDVALLVPKVVGFDGEIHYLCKRNPYLFIMFLRSFSPKFLRHIFRKKMLSFEMRDQDYDKLISPVYFPSGCCMLFRTTIAKQVKGFDERFFMYFEDADIGRRINQVAKTMFNPQLVVKHKWTRGSHNSIKLRWITIQSAWRYYRKWGGIFNAKYS